MTPLSKKTRKILIVISLIIFAMIVPLVLANSFGYKITSLEDALTLIRTGGIYLRTDVSDMMIFINDEKVEDTRQLLRNTLIQNLRPDAEYRVVTMREGYHDWRKTLSVYPSLVTEASVLMLPTEIKERTILPHLDAQGVGTTTPSINSRTGRPAELPTNSEYLKMQEIFEESISDESLAASDLSSGQPAQSGTTALTETTATNSVSDSGEIASEKIPKYFIRLGIDDPSFLQNLIETNNQVAWILDGNVYINWIDDDSTPHYYYCIDPTNCRNEIVLDWADDILAFDYMPGSDEFLIVLVSDGIFATEVDDRSERNIQPVFLGRDLEFRRVGRSSIVVRDDDIFYELDL